MIRIIFDNGDVANCEHIDKIYLEECEADKITIVSKVTNNYIYRYDYETKEKMDVRESDSGN